jgi:hypothetical protein
MDSSLDRRLLRLVLAWAELHHDELADNWHAHEPVKHSVGSSPSDDRPNS